MIERTEMSTAASRRVFHSKVDTIRPTYGFEDVSLAPGTDTIEPADVDLSQSFCGIELTIPVLAHRILLKPEARVRRYTTDNLLREVLGSVTVPQALPREEVAGRA